MNDVVLYDLVGKTLTSVERISKPSVGDVIRFTTVDGHKYEMCHQQDCCEHVRIEDLCGDLEDLVGSPIIRAEESSNNNDATRHPYEDSQTWTFYRIATAKGLVVIRWLGESNGYYSESVDFYEIQ